MSVIVNPKPAATADEVLAQTAEGIRQEKLCRGYYVDAPSWATCQGPRFCLIGWLCYAAGVPVPETEPGDFGWWPQAGQEGEGGGREQTRKEFPVFDEALRALDAEALERISGAKIYGQWDSPAEALLEELVATDAEVQDLISRARQRLLLEPLPA